MTWARSWMPSPRSTRHLFDFTNSPVMFGFGHRYEQAYALLPRQHGDSVGGAARPDQRPREFRSLRSSWDMATPWDFLAWDQIPNMVRHYEVNRYLQTHYRPVVAVDGLLFLLRDDLSFEAGHDPRLDLNGWPCSGTWTMCRCHAIGEPVPERFEPQPAPNAAATGALPLDDVDGHPRDHRLGRGLAERGARTPRRCAGR